MTQVAEQTYTDVSSEVTPAADQNQFLTFTLGGEVYAIEILSIREIIDYGDLTTVPMMPDYIRGVINLRGSVVPVVDLAARFGDEPAEITKRTGIIIIEIADDDTTLNIGAVVDGVNEVLEIPPGDIEPPPSFGARIRTDFIRGMGKVRSRSGREGALGDKVDDKFLVLLDVASVLSVEELSLLDETQHQAQAETVIETGEAVNLPTSIAEGA